MELRTERVLGYEEARMAAMSLLHDIEHSLNIKANSYWEYLRFSSIHSEKFEAYNKMDSSARRDEIIKDDYPASREAIMLDAIQLYIKNLDERNTKK